MEKTMEKTIEERYEQATFVAKFDTDDIGRDERADNHDFFIEVRKEEDGNYIAFKIYDEEEDYIDGFDFDEVLAYHRKDIKEWYEYRADCVLENASYQLVLVVNQEELEDLIEKSTDHTAEAYSEYALQYYYNDSEDDRLKEEALAVQCDDIDSEILECTTEVEDED